MKLVLFSVIIVITVVQVSPACRRVSGQNSTKQTRRYIPIKEEKYTTRLNTDDPFSEQLRTDERYELHERPFLTRPSRRSRNMKEMSPNPRRNNKRNFRFRNETGRGLNAADAKPSRSMAHERKSETNEIPYKAKSPVLQFRSPEQLQEYLFSEAANAKHILRNGPSLYNPSNHVDGERPPVHLRGREREHDDPVMNDENASRNSWDSQYRSRKLPSRASQIRPENIFNEEHDWSDVRGYSISPPNNFDEPFGHGTGKEFFDDGVQQDYPMRNPNYIVGPNVEPEDFGFHHRLPYIHPMDMPYFYPPPWYNGRIPFYMPRIKLKSPYDRKLYENPSYTTTTRTVSTTERKNDEFASLGDDVAKLKQMVDELDAMSEETKEQTSGGGKPESEKNKEKNDTVTDVREKLDKIIIPLLTKISKDLSSNSSSISTKRSDSEGDMKKDKEKDRDKDKEKEKDKDRERDKDKEAESKKDFPCKIDGVWTGTNEALQLNITTMPNMTVKVSIISENPKKSNGINKDWSINGLTISSFGGPFMFAAVYPEKKRVANFIGQCRSCREEDIIFGLWTFSSAGKDCSEMFTTVETKIDVFRREKSQQPKSDKSTKSFTER